MLLLQNHFQLLDILLYRVYIRDVANGSPPIRALGKQMALVNEIAKALNIEENQVVKHTELPYVFSVVFRNLDGVKCCTFVSKKLIQKNLGCVVELHRNRRQSRPWIARITGLCSAYGFKREFINPINPEWDRKGMSKADFVLMNGLYHDCDGDYAVVENGEYLVISKDEAKYRLESQLKIKL